jgi:hypothetical protein
MLAGIVFFRPIVMAAVLVELGASCCTHNSNAFITLTPGGLLCQPPTFQVRPNKSWPIGILLLYMSLPI